MIKLILSTTIFTLEFNFSVYGNFGDCAEASLKDKTRSIYSTRRYGLDFSIQLSLDVTNSRFFFIFFFFLFFCTVQKSGVYTIKMILTLARKPILKNITTSGNLQRPATFCVGRYGCRGSTGR